MKNWPIYMTLHLSIAILLTAAFGGAVNEYFQGKSAPEMALHMLAAAGGGWGILLLLGRMKLNSWQTYLLGLGKIMSIGVIVLLPSILLISPTFHPIWLPLINVALSFTVMLYMNIKLCQKLKLSYDWALTWALSLGSFSLIWTTLFFLA